jgi:hypothetical protein
VSWAPTARLLAYPWLVAALLLAALATGRPELAAAAAPIAAVLLAGLLRSRRPALPAVRVSASAARVVEGDTLDLTLNVDLPAEIEALEVGVLLSPGIEVVDAPNPAILARAGGARQSLTISLRPVRWGAYFLGTVHLRAFDDFRLRRFEARVRADVVVRVYPRTAARGHTPRPTWARLRRRCRRAEPGGSQHPAGVGGGGTRTTHLAAGAGDAPGALSPGGHRHRLVDGGRTPGTGGDGGRRVATSRPAPRPLIPALMAVMLAAVLAAGGSLHADAAAEYPWRVAAVAAVGGLGLLVTVVAVAAARPGLVGWAVALLAAQHATLVIGGGASVDLLAPLVGLGLLFVAELSHTACEWRGPHAVDASVELRRWARLAAAGVAGAVAGGGALALAAAVPGSVPALLIGAVGAVGLVGLATWLRHSTSGEARHVA